jgi:hypothetical protein
MGARDFSHCDVERENADRGVVAARPKLSSLISAGAVPLPRGRVTTAMMLAIAACLRLLHTRALSYHTHQSLTFKTVRHNQFLY